MARRKINPDAVHLQGTHLEGGGQLLRLATGLSALTSTPLAITNIRGNRSGVTGLKAQHLTAVSWLASATEARVLGMVKKSKDFVMIPPSHAGLDEKSFAHDPTLASLLGREAFTQMPRVLESQVDIGSPGAISLVFQAILPLILFSAPEALSSKPLEQFHITIKGGTNTTLSPSIDYLEHVVFPMLKLIGLPGIECHISSRGWLTGSSEIGSVTFSITPLPAKQSLPAFQLRERGNIVGIRAIVLAPPWSRPYFERVLSSSVKAVADLKGMKPTVDFEESGHRRRIYLLLIATSENGMKLGHDLLAGAESDSRQRGGGRKSKPPDDFTANDVTKIVERVVKGLASELEHGGCVDEHMRDQLVVFQALAKGRSFVTGGTKDGMPLAPSLHAKTAQWVANEIVGATFDQDGGCEGIGFVVGEWCGRESGEEVSDLAAELDDIHI